MRHFHKTANEDPVRRHCRNTPTPDTDLSLQSECDEFILMCQSSLPTICQLQHRTKLPTTGAIMRNLISKAKSLIAEDCSTYESLLVNLNVFLFIGILSTLIYTLVRVLVLPEDIFLNDLFQHYSPNLDLQFLIPYSASILETTEATVCAYQRAISSWASIIYYVVSLYKIPSQSDVSSSSILLQPAHSTLLLWTSWTTTSTVENYFMMYASNTLLDPHIFLP